VQADAVGASACFFSSGFSRTGVLMQDLEKKPQNRSFLSSLGVDIQLLTLIFALIAVWIGFQIWSGGIFLSPRNLWNLTAQTAVVGIMVGGMVLVIVARQIDLSVGSVLGFSAMIMAKLQAPVSEGGASGLGWNWIIAMLVGIGVAMLIGALTGYLSAYWSVPAFVVTLAGMLVFRNGTFSVSAFTISPLDQTFQILGGGINGSIGALWTWIFGAVAVALIVWQTLTARARRIKNEFAVRPMWAEALVLGITVAVIVLFVVVMNSYPIPGTDTPSGIPVPTLIALGVLIYLNWMTRATRFGRYIFAIGGNPEAANLAGINVKRMMVYIFVVMGFLTGLAAAVQAARLQGATPNLGRDLELTVIAGAVIGGTVLAGGSGTILGAALGALLMSSLENGLGLVGVPTEQQKIYLGIVLLLAVLWNVVSTRRKGGRS
jgi:D-xylose transport system permease protein